MIIGKFRILPICLESKKQIGAVHLSLLCVQSLDKLESFI